MITINGKPRKGWYHWWLKNRANSSVSIVEHADGATLSVLSTDLDHLYMDWASYTICCKYFSKQRNIKLHLFPMWRDNG